MELASKFTQKPLKKKLYIIALILLRNLIELCQIEFSDFNLFIQCSLLDNLLSFDKVLSILQIFLIKQKKY